jgi:hypothetical protein
MAAAVVELVEGLPILVSNMPQSAVCSTLALDCFANLSAWRTSGLDDVGVC